MKIQEAINCIDDVLNSDYHYDESLGYQLTSDDFEWLEKAKEALEKRYYKEIAKGNFEKADKIMKQIVTLDVARLNK